MLEVDNIHSYYGSIHALKGVSLIVEKGEIVTDSDRCQWRWQVHDPADRHRFDETNDWTDLPEWRRYHSSKTSLDCEKRDGHGSRRQADFRPINSRRES